MGTSFGLACITCKEWVELNKCRQTFYSVMGEKPEYDQLTKFDAWSAQAALWFLWRHRSHDTQWIDDQCECLEFYEESGPIDKVREDDLEIEKSYKKVEPWTQP